MIRRAVIAALALTSGSSAFAAPRLETAVLAGGCFWGVEAVFEHVKGVRRVVSGYAGGRAADATYGKVSGKRTGHAESVRVSFDPREIGYGDLLRIFFAVAHDPTQLNRQGPDVGPNYRSAIFPQNFGQRRLAQGFIARLNTLQPRHRPVVTKVENGSFYPAESYHQDFMRRNPRHAYIVLHDAPKVAALRRAFPGLYRNAYAASGKRSSRSATGTSASASGPTARTISGWRASSPPVSAPNAGNITLRVVAIKQRREIVRPR
jgi:peptide-methionine (S)-S-oxide reductase